MMPQQTILALVLASTFSAFAIPVIYSTSDNLAADQEDPAFDMRTAAEIYQEYFGSDEGTNTPVISDELANRLLNGAWYDIAETDQGRIKQEILDQARSRKSKAVNLSSTSSGKSSSNVPGNNTGTQQKRYRNQTISERSRSKLISTAASRIRQSVRNQQQISAKEKRQRDISRGHLRNSQKRSIFSSTRRFRHTRSGTTPGN